MTGKTKKAGTPRKQKRDKPKPKLARSRSKAPLHKKGRFIGTLRSLWAIFFAALSILASVAGIYALSPRITVSSLPSLDPVQIFSTPFTILNDGYLIARDVQATCFVSDAKDINGNHFAGGFAFTDTQTQNVGDLHSKEPATLPCAFVSNFVTAPIASANITIDVSYRPQWYPWHITKRFRFVTAPAVDGQLHWLPQPVGSENTNDAPKFIRVYPTP